MMLIDSETTEPICMKFCMYVRVHPGRVRSMVWLLYDRWRFRNSQKCVIFHIYNNKSYGKHNIKDNDNLKNKKNLVLLLCDRGRYRIPKKVYFKH